MIFKKFMELASSKKEIPNVPNNTKNSDSIENNEYIKVCSPSLDKAERNRLEHYTIFALFLPYTRMELTGEIIEHDDTYPHEFREVKRYITAAALWDAYANTPCPGSQMIMAVDEKDYEEQLALWNKRYDDREWLNKNLFPYL